MPLTESPDLNLLYIQTLKEIENNDIQQLDSEFYQTLSQFLGKLKTEEYDGIEAKMKNKLANIFSTLTSLIINTRLEKFQTQENLERKNLTDEEKFVLDSNQETNERKDLIIQSIIHGKSKLLKSISDEFNKKLVVIRFLKDNQAISGINSEKYGPFKAEDVATIPNENAQELIQKNIATRIRIEK